MVAIIDDREDVWGRCANLIHVKPYVFFAGTSDINAPPGSHPSQPHKKNTAPSISSHVTHPHKASTNPSPPTQNTSSDSKPVEKILATVTADNGSIHDIVSPDLAAPMEGDSPTQDILGAPMEGDSPTQDILAAPMEGDSPTQDIFAAPMEGDSPTQDILAAPIEGDSPTQDTLAPMEPDKDAQDILAASMEGDKDAQDILAAPMEGDKDANSSSSNSESDSEDSSSSSSSSVDDTAFDALENSSSNDNFLKIQPPPSNETTPTNVQENMENSSSCLNVQPPSTDEATPTNGIYSVKVSSKTDVVEASSKEEEMETDKSPPTKTREIKDTDKFLLHLTHTLKQVHKMFYDEYDAMSSKSRDLATPDVKRIIPQIRHSVLKGTKILFTGVIPTNLPHEKSPEWNTARAFGATVHDRFVYGLSSANPLRAMRATTHVVVGRPGTSKLREARRIPGIKIVTPQWLWGCAEQWELVDEREFPVEFDEQEQIDAKTSAKLPKIAAKKQKIELQKQSSRKNESSARCPVAMETRAKNRVVERHMSIDSVSDEELERMNAEVDAEIGSSSSSSNEDPAEEPGQGTVVETTMDQEEESCDKFTELSSDNGRKRKHEDVSSSSDNSPQSIGLLDESVDLSENDSGSGDDLADLLGT